MSDITPADTIFVAVNRIESTDGEGTTLVTDVLPADYPPEWIEALVEDGWTVTQYIRAEALELWR